MFLPFSNTFLEKVIKKYVDGIEICDNPIAGWAERCQNVCFCYRKVIFDKKSACGNRPTEENCEKQQIGLKWVAVGAFGTSPMPKCTVFRTWYAHYHKILLGPQKWRLKSDFSVNFRSNIFGIFLGNKIIWSNYNGVAAKSQKRTKVEKKVVFPYKKSGRWNGSYWNDTRNAKKKLK